MTPIPCSLKAKRLGTVINSFILLTFPGMRISNTYFSDTKPFNLVLSSSIDIP